MPAPQRKINLLPPSEFESSFWGRFLEWAITTGRYIVIITELIVVMAFLSRFKLDTDLSTLNSEIKSKKNVLDEMIPREEQFKTWQSRTKAAGQIIDGVGKQGETLALIATKIPEEVKFSTLIVSENNASITGGAMDENSLGVFLMRLTKEPKWRSIDLTGLSQDKQKGLLFSLSIKK